MFDSFEKAHKYVVEHGIEMIDLKFTDLWGRMRHLTIPASSFTPDILENGVGFDGFSVGFRPIESSDMVLIPDLSTGFVDPFWDAPTLSFICYVRAAGSNELFPDDPRSVALKAVKYMLDKGVADQSKWGVELEFWVFDSVSFENKNHVASYRIVSEEFNPQGELGHGYYNPHEGGYHSSPPQDSLYNLRSEISLHLQKLGFKLRYHHHEVGVPGQCEIETSMLGLMEAADAVTLAKYVTKMVAKAYGKTVTFMPKPLYNTAGTALHLHQQLFKEGRNLFYDPSRYGLLSEIGRYYVGGLLTHCPALLGLTNPSTNSYLRLVPGFEAPVSLFFSVGNRSAAVRIPGYATQPDKVRIEFRPPDPTCNIYLAMAAQLMAGIDGILNKIDPTEAGFGPFEENVYDWTEEQKARLKPLPSSLKEALEALAEDHDFLLAGGVFSKELIERWIEHKMREYYAVRTRPHPYEIELYFNV